MRFFKDNLFLLTLCFLVSAAALDSKNVLAGGDPSIKDSKIVKKKSNITQHDHKKTYLKDQKKLSSKDTKNDGKISQKSSNGTNKDENVETAGFAAIEDVPLIIDLSSVTDSDGMGSVSVQWQISPDNNKWTNISGATNQSFTPREIHVGSRLRVAISYVDGQGNLEPLISPPSTPVRNVNDKPTGSARLIGSSVEDSALVVDTSSIADEDGIASISISWETSKDGRNWIGVNSLSGPILSLGQSLVGSQVRARVAVVDNFGIETNLYSQATRTVENVNNKPSGRIVIRRVGQ